MRGGERSLHGQPTPSYVHVEVVPYTAYNIYKCEAVVIQALIKKKKPLTKRRQPFKTQNRPGQNALAKDAPRPDRIARKHFSNFDNVHC